ncbi:MAG: undecaprenyl diphosphate synthase [Pseudomonadota bacterium]|nr:undecaprenyl diphosphate synthase [Pseudomonadota bacterium]
MVIPKHVAIIMDGNGRWAKKRLLPRVAGHVRGVKRVKEIVEHCSELGIRYLTLFAFGRENWRRPKEEVSFLMNLLSEQISKEFYKLHEKNVRIRFMGDKTRLSHAILGQVKDIEQLTSNNNKLNLNIALDYSGTYDIVQAVNRIIANSPTQPITEEIFSQYLLSYPDPDPELLIRTSGESRVSNFILWQLAYSECYFTSKLWPDFDKRALDSAIEWFNSRERRFGMTSEQLKK